MTDEMISKRLSSLLLLILSLLILSGCGDLAEEVPRSDYAKSVLEAVKTANPPARHDLRNLETYKLEVLDLYDAEACRAGGHSGDCYSLLEQVGLFYSKHPDMPNEKELLASSRKLYSAGCRDAMVIYVLGSALEWAGDFENAIEVLQRNVAEMETSNYASFRKYSYNHKLFLLESGLRRPNPAALKRAENHLFDAIKQGEIRSREQRVLDGLTAKSKYGSQLMEDFWRRTIAVSEGNPQLNIVLKIEYYIKKAWASRGGGYAHTISREGAKGWSSYLHDAYQEGLRGMRYPEIESFCATKLIEVSLGNADARKYIKEWFLISLDTEINSNQPYQKMCHFLLPRWHGSIEALREISSALIDSKRYDTYAPLGGIYFYLRSVHDQFEGSPALIRQHLSSSPNTDKMIHAARMTLKEDRMVINHATARSYLCYLYYLKGNHSKAKKYFGDANLWNIKYYFYRAYPDEARAIIRSFRR